MLTPRVVLVPKQVCGAHSPFLLQKAVLRKPAAPVGMYVETALRETKAGISCDSSKALAIVSMPVVCQGSFYLLLYFGPRITWGLGLFSFYRRGSRG